MRLIRGVLCIVVVRGSEFIEYVVQGQKVPFWSIGGGFWEEVREEEEDGVEGGGDVEVAVLDCLAVA